MFMFMVPLVCSLEMLWGRYAMLGVLYGLTVGRNVLCESVCINEGCKCDPAPEADAIVLSGPTAQLIFYKAKGFSIMARWPLRASEE